MIFSGCNVIISVSSRAKPHFGKFSYIEKFEYWAFMWGMLLMTVTGFNCFGLKILP